jgi:pimeloyl-ACP methyl ester carboxylesterase
MGWYLEKEPYPYDYSYQEGAEDGYQFRGKLIHIDEIQRLYVEKRGNGPPLLFIPGLAGDAANFIELADVLSDEFTVIMYDRRGYSRSQRGWIRVTLEEQADDIAKILDVLELPHTIIMSSSMGGAIAFQFMLRHADRLKGAILHEPFWLPTFSSDPAAIKAEVDANIKIVQNRREKDCGLLEGRLRYLLSDETLEYFHAASRQRVAENTETTTVEREMLSQWIPSAEEFAAISRIPFSILLGKSTKPFFAEVVEAFAKRLQVKTVSVPGGHAGFIDHADKVASLIQPILKKFLQGGA